MKSFLTLRFFLYVVCAAFCACANFAAGADASSSNAPSLSIGAPAKLDAWQKHLSLGPGDILQVSLYGEPDALRNGLVVGPDGRLNYLQARDVMVTGLTVEELRAKLEEVLLKFYRPPVRVIVIPQAYRSKKYALLGSVTQSGVFYLDQPITIVEAIAKAQGFASGTTRRTLPMVDLARSFLMRKGEDGAFKKLDVDFEALFLQGDLEQNRSLAPDDYLYFPPLEQREVYVLGHVHLPGAVALDTAPTAVAAIAAKGGFGEKAYKSKVLIVRGSLTNPQTIVFNCADVLNGKAPDFKLQAKDIVYVSKRPWALAEELLEAAITDFMRAAIITYTGQHVGPFIKEPIVH